MIQHAEADNARLLQHFPKGYSFGGARATHRCCSNLHTADLDKTFAAAATAFAKEDPTSWKLKALQVLLHSRWAHRSCRHRNRAAPTC